MSDEKKHGGAREGAGRPTNYDPSMCKRVPEIMADGSSLLAVMAELKIKSKATLHEWRKRYPEFDEACRIGQLLARAAIEDLGLRGARGEIAGFNAAAWIFIAKNRLRYANEGNYADDEFEIPGLDAESTENLSDEQRRQRIAELLAAARTRRDGTSADGSIH